MTYRIVVGVDGSDGSRGAMRWAAEEARLRGADLDVVHAWHHPYESFVPSWPAPPLAELEQGARGMVDGLIAAEGLPDRSVPVANAIVVPQSASIALIEAARGAELLVVGSRGRGAFRGMLLGSVSQHCVTHAPCTVVVVRPSAELEGDGDRL